VDHVVKKPGKFIMKFEPADGFEDDKWEQEVYNFKDGGGPIMGMYNTDQSINTFANTCFKYSLDRGFPLKLSTKNTILKKYDGRFKDIFEEVY
jgi:isocitrate dehydrogenase